MLKAYYAHCMAIYNTKQEGRDINLICKLGYEVINPNTEESQVGFKAKGMDYVLKFAEECDLIIFRALPDGRIPSGVAIEIQMFKDRGKPIIELPSGFLNRKMTLEETIEYLQESGQR